MGEGKGDGKVLEIHTTDIKLTAPVFQTQAQNLSTALTTLVTTLDGLGAPWGDDEQGKSFYDAYHPQQPRLMYCRGEGC
ncbi:hypothetical protein FBY35_6592 [Streptomyces sp. SLBN-118]|uniref:hypothetical protein n=1 Tax=Streptomyces sp. SLBN-118 TaxID=2768454 RepID=UPI001171488D|nr:hypothetical protein [Streptomyces sp. SLBN-118]TQK45051.1 hypothetical protein FBY35_6592 [Streptomyces sp. SLBN-118]